jgi:hypothetical protein
MEQQGDAKDTPVEGGLKFAVRTVSNTVKRADKILQQKEWPTDCESIEFHRT